MVVPIAQAYIDMINSFREQCKEFITKFKEQGSEEFSAFAKIFIANKISLTYEKYANSYFYHDFKEDSLQIAKYIMLNNNFIGGLYMIYGLYFIQDEPKQTVRLEYQEFEKIKERVLERRKTLLKTCEPCFVFAKLLQNEAFSFTCFTREFSMEGVHRARLVHSNHTLVKAKSLVNKEEWLQDFLQGRTIGDDIKRIDEQFSAMKEKMKKEHSALNLNLDLTGGIFDGLVANLTEDKPQTVQENIGDRRRNLKERPMRKQRKYKCNNKNSAVDHPKKKYKCKDIESAVDHSNKKYDRKKGCHVFFNSQ